MRPSYCCFVSVIKFDSTTDQSNGGDTFITVTLALTDFAKAIPRSIACSESSEPSVGIKILLYVLSPPPDFTFVRSSKTSCYCRLFFGQQLEQNCPPGRLFFRFETGFIVRNVPTCDEFSHGILQDWSRPSDR